jgi:hypothetical protein
MIIIIMIIAIIIIISPLYYHSITIFPVLFFTSAFFPSPARCRDGRNRNEENPWTAKECASAVVCVCLASQIERPIHGGLRIRIRIHKGLYCVGWWF